MLGDLKTGSVLGGRYRLERPLGRGGMGAVYLATHVGLERSVAVKVLDLTLENSPQAVERFKREGLATASIRHPNVVEVVDNGTTDTGFPYLVMEYLEGPTLRAFLRRYGALEPGVAVAIAEQMLEALEAAHAAGVLHRDLKPANVLLATGARPAVKLLDFGISKMMRSVTVITRTGVAMGTPAFMSPEQMAGEKELTPATDLYSFGAMLFEMLSGRPPFQAPNDMLLMQRVVVTPAPALQSIRGTLPGSLCRLVDSLLVKEPSARPQTASETRRQLLAAAGPAPSRLWFLVSEFAAGKPPSIGPSAAEQLATPERESVETDVGAAAIAAVPTTPQLQAVQQPNRGLTVGVASGVAAAMLLVVGWELFHEPEAPKSDIREIAPAPSNPPLRSLPIAAKKKELPKVVPVEAPAPTTATPPADPDLIALDSPDPRVPPPPRPEREQRIIEQQKRNDAALARADEALKSGDLAGAQELLATCKVGTSPCPEARTKMDIIRAEKEFKTTLDKAERAIAKKEMALAQQLLGQSYGTTVFVERHKELENRLREQLSQAMVTKKAPEVSGRPVAGVTPPSATRTSESEKLREEARELNKKSEYPAARAKLLTCIQLEPNNADCHKLLGSTYALLKDNKKGVFHYKKFLELKPDHPSAAKVKAIIDSYESTQK